MAFPVPGDPLVTEQTEVTEQVFGFCDTARSAGQTLRSFGFQAIAFLLGIALAFM